MVKIIFDKKFQKAINKIKDNSIKDSVKKQIDNKIIKVEEIFFLELKKLGLYNLRYI